MLSHQLQSNGGVGEPFGRIWRHIQSAFSSPRWFGVQVYTARTFLVFFSLHVRSGDKVLALRSSLVKLGVDNEPGRKCDCRLVEDIPNGRICPVMESLMLGSDPEIGRAKEDVDLTFLHEMMVSSSGSTKLDQNLTALCGGEGLGMGFLTLLYKLLFER